MRSKRILKCSLPLALVVMLIASAQSQVQPDLIVRRVSVTKDPTGQFVNKVTVNVGNGCMNSSAAASYVLVTFKQSSANDAKAIYYIGNTVRALKGGESHIQTFDVSEKKIGTTKFIFAEADPYKKVLEASEDNNWFTVNPYGNGPHLAQGQCLRKM